MFFFMKLNLGRYDSKPWVWTCFHRTELEQKFWLLAALAKNNN